MPRFNVPVRRDWTGCADNGFDFHIIDNETVDESRAYFTLRQIEEQIENRLRNCIRCLEWWIARKDEEILTQRRSRRCTGIATPAGAHAILRCMAVDFAWCGNARCCWRTPIRQLHYTSRLISSGCGWKMPGAAALFRAMPISQCHSERLISRFSELTIGEPFYFLLLSDDEDRSTVLLAGLRRAGRAGVSVYLREDLGWGRRRTDRS